VRLAAGEQLAITNRGTAHVRQPIDTGTVGGWRTGQLHYIDEPLAAVVADVRRYADRTIEVTDPAIGELRITGTVFENDVESLLRTLEAAFAIRASTDGKGKIVLEPTTPPCAAVEGHPCGHSAKSVERFWQR